MKFGLWGHAMMLASKLDKKVQNDVTNRYGTYIIMLAFIFISCYYKSDRRNRWDTWGFGGSIVIVLSR